MDVRLSGRMQRWPQQCVCCGEPPTTTIELSRRRVEGRRRITTKLAVPYCEFCTNHHKKLPDPGDWLLYGFVSLVLCFPLVPLVWFLYRQEVKKTKRLVGPSCCDTPNLAVGFRSTSGQDIVLAFSNEAYGALFKAANE